MTEVSKEILEKAFEAVEIAKKSGKIKKGTNEVTKVIERGSAKLVLIAKDVNPREIIMHLTPLCKEKNIPLIEVNTREELGTVAGLKIPTSSIAVIEEGNAKKIIEEIVEKLK